MSKPGKSLSSVSSREGAQRGLWGGHDFCWPTLLSHACLLPGHVSVSSWAVCPILASLRDVPPFRGMRAIYRTSRAASPLPFKALQVSILHVCRSRRWPGDGIFPPVV